MFDFGDSINIKDMENQLFENFGEKYLPDVIRILATGTPTYTDGDLIRDALSIILALYTQKLKDGEINSDRTLH